MSTDNMETILAAGRALGEVKLVGLAPVMVVPDGYEVTDLEKHLDTPSRARGTATLLDAQSFIDYVKRNHDDDVETALGLYFTAEPPRFTAVFNDHSAALAGWRDFTAIYSAPLSREWKEWTARDGQAKPFTQEDFAFFIEKNLLDVTTPTSAEFLELAQHFQATKAVNFASGMRLGNGQNQLVYEETIAAKAGEKGQLAIPETFQITIPVFEGDAPYQITAKLRYRITEQKLRIWYDLERPHKVLEDAVQHLRTTIEAGTGLKAFNGSPA